MRIKLVFLFLCTIIYSSSLSQVTKIDLTNKQFNELLNDFVTEIREKYDSIGILNDRLGVISINMQSVDSEIFPFDISLDRLYNKTGTDSVGGKHIIFSISMIARKDFFEVYTPQIYSIFQGKPVVFFTGVELLSRTKSSNRFFDKLLRPHLNSFEKTVIWWLIEMDFDKSSYRVIQKRSFF